MSGRDALLRAYKERKVEAGVYAVRCAATATSWGPRSRGAASGIDRRPTIGT